jgi:hypothetical protein
MPRGLGWDQCVRRRSGQGCGVDVPRRMGSTESHMCSLAGHALTRQDRARIQEAALGLGLPGLRHPNLPRNEAVPQGISFVVGDLEG